MTTLRLRAAAAALVLLVPGMPACRAEPAAGTNLEIASTFPGSMPILGDAARGLAPARRPGIGRRADAHLP